MLSEQEQAWMQARLVKRHRAAKRFRLYGYGALGFAGLMLALLLGNILWQAGGALWRHELVLELRVPPAELSAPLPGPSDALYGNLVREGVGRLIGPEAAESKKSLRAAMQLVSRSAAVELHHWLHANPEAWGKPVALSLRLSDRADMFLKGKLDINLPEALRPVSDQQVRWLEDWQKDGKVAKRLNLGFFVGSDSRLPELAGIGGSFVGTLFLLLVCLLVAFPLAVMSAVYLEEFAPRNRLTTLIEVTINNLAAVPSILYGLLGLSLWLHWGGLPRSSALVGGLTLALMVLPVIIIATRTALAQVPQSLRDAARGLGATRVQMVLHHVVPLAMPGIMTGTILGMARAMGETAPLLMIGMVAFVADIPEKITHPATAMPVQVFLWSDSPELAFAEKTALLILVLLAMLTALNLLAAWVRRKFEIKW
jgi:phosphate transport system permease protein